MSELAEKKPEGLTLVLFSGDMDKTLAAFNLAVTAASMGKSVTIFFTFWGLNAIRKEGLPSKKVNWMRRAMSLLNRGGSDRLKLSKFNMMGAGTAMMKKLMKDVKMPSVAEMIEMAKGLGVKFVACTTTIGVMGLSEDDFIPEVDEFAGAATYLGEADASHTNLFIS